MKITAKVNIYEKDSLKGFASLNIEDKIVIKNLRIVEGDNGLFVAYPSTKNAKEDKWYEDVYPLTSEVRETIQNIVLEEYEKVNKKSKKSKNEV